MTTIAHDQIRRGSACPSDFDTGLPLARFAGTVRADDGETWCHYAAYSADVVAEVLADEGATLADVDRDELAVLLTGWAEYYRGPGRAFNILPHVRVYRNGAVLVWQRGGLDV